MKGVNRQEVLHLIVGTIIIILLFWLLSSGLMDDALARLAQLNLYSATSITKRLFISQ